MFFFFFWGWWFALPKSPVKCFLVVQGFGEDDGVVDLQSSVEVISDLRVTEPDGTSRPATRSEQEELRAHLDLEREMDAEQAEGDAARYKEYYEGVLQEARQKLNVAQARAAREFDNATMEQATVCKLGRTLKRSGSRTVSAMSRARS